MSSSKFLSSLPFILRWEGGFVDHPNDPGGRTNKGVIQKVYDSYRRSQGLPTRDVKLIQDEEVHEIYEADYWKAARCESLDTPLHLVVFDTAVNMGVGRSIRFLQTVAGCEVDGSFGPNTARAVDACDQKAAVGQYCDLREQYYRNLAERPKLAVFLRGWLNRLNSLRKEAGIPFESGMRGPGSERAQRIPDIGIDPLYDI